MALSIHSIEKVNKEDGNATILEKNKIPCGVSKVNYCSGLGDDLG